MTNQAAAAAEEGKDTDISNPKRRRRSAPASMTSKDSGCREESGCSRTGEDRVSWSLPHAIPSAGHELMDRSFPGWIWNGAGPRDSDFNIHVSQGSPLPHMTTFAQKCSEK